MGCRRKLSLLPIAVIIVAPLGCKNVVSGSDKNPEPSDGSAPLPGGGGGSRVPGGTTDSSPGGNFGLTEAQVVCREPAGSPARLQALRGLAQYAVGGTPWNAESSEANAAACVDALKPIAMYVNLTTGVPVGTLIGQAVQETAFCTSELARKAFNMHGMKATLPPAHFTHWTGEKYAKSSSESPTGSGMNRVSEFMKFRHRDHSFVSLAERLIHPDLPYKTCFPGRDRTAEFMRCVGKSWAVHAEYAEKVLEHRAKFNLEGCELRRDEWSLKGKFVGR